MFFTAMDIYRYSYGEYPAGNTRQVTGALLNPPPCDFNPEGHSLLGDLTGKEVGRWFDADGSFLDEWGRPMHLVVDALNRAIVLTSLGPNGEDDGGEGDDVVYTTAYTPEGEEPRHPLDRREGVGPRRVNP